MGTGIRAGRTPRLVLLAGLCATACGLSAGAASAQAANWQCRGSAASSATAGNPALEPVVANSGFSPCVNATTGPSDAGPPAGQPGTLRTGTGSAATSIAPATGPAAVQAIGAVGRIENAAIALGPGGAVTLGVRQAIARVSGGCAAGAPALAGSGDVSGLSVNGTELPLAQAIAQLSAALAPLGQVVDLRLNEEIRDATTLSHRALHLRVLTAAGTPLEDVILGEARGGFIGAVCQDTGTGAGAGVAGTGFTAPGTDPCPRGSTLDAPTGFCVIREPGSGVQGERVIRVGRPFEGPSGGTVIALDQARRRFHSACLSGPGPQFAVVGTNRNDRITGTNRADRILLLAGKDRGDGGRGADCIDGGTGRDVLSGAQDRDRVYGMAGNDSINGGPAADRLSGGTGNDTINAAFGADHVSGGSGRDAINVATAGPRAHVSCGAGRDTVRLNASERRTARGCERMLILPDKRLKRRR
jgi:RTX calcium-binding nonapeptide repeat (4 copies)